MIQKLDYLGQMGVTAVWLTPLFEQIEAMVWDSAPIHGYWTRDFKRIHARWVAGEEEVRFFAREDTTLDRLIAGLHDRGMKMVLDIVCNHTSPDASGVKGQLYDDGTLIADFHNDVDNWYHHYGPVTDWQVENCELAGLATFNENNDMVSVRPDVFMFGEWIYSHPKLQESVDFANLSGMSILDFGLCLAIRGALGTREPRGFGLVTECSTRTASTARRRSSSGSSKTTTCGACNRSARTRRCCAWRWRS